MSRTVAHVRNKNEVGIDLLCAEENERSSIIDIDVQYFSSVLAE